MAVVMQPLEAEAAPLVSRKSAGRPALVAPKIESLDAASDEPIERQVYIALRRAMMSGAVLPGARISSRSIASSLGVSSMPVREALKRLESDGAVASSMKSAFTVNYPSVAEFREILQLRLLLETFLARAATPNIAVANIDRAAWLEERMAQSSSHAQVLQYNYQMHFLIYQSANMPYALSLVENMWVKIGPLLHSIYADQKITAALFNHHSAIVDGLRARNCDDVERAIRADLEDAGAVIVRTLLQLHGTAA